MKMGNKKGMTIVELMIAIFILTLMVLVTIAVATAYLKGKTRVKRYQSNVEEMSLALNLLAKEVRMSNCDDSTYCNLPDSPNALDSIEVINNSGSQSEGVSYSFSGGKLTRQAGSAPPETILDDVNGKFYVSPGSSVSCISGCVSESCCFANRVNRITITIRKNDQTGITLETTVSMRGGYNGN